MPQAPEAEGDLPRRVRRRAEQVEAAWAVVGVVAMVDSQAPALPERRPVPERGPRAQKPRQPPPGRGGVPQSEARR